MTLSTLVKFQGKDNQRRGLSVGRELTEGEQTRFEVRKGSERHALSFEVKNNWLG